jgi:glutamyl-tRNA reductase
VRSAYDRAHRVRATSLVLSALFRRAIGVGKRVRTETTISQRAASVSSAAVQLAMQALGDLQGRRALVIGAGKTGRLVGQALLGRGVAHIVVANRTPDAARELAAEWGGEAVGLDRLPAGLAEADMVISATNAPHYLVTADMVAVAMARRQDRPLVLIDIAVPRDFDPAAADVPGARVFNMDDLAAVVEANLAGRGQDVAAAQGIVGGEVVAFMDWSNGLAATPAIVNLRQHAETIRQRELARFSHRLDGLTDHDRALVEMLTQRIVNQLLHEPTVRLKRHACQDDGSLYSHALSELFALSDGREEDEE